MSTEKQLEKLENEAKAIKASFQQSTTDMDVYTSEVTFSTSANIIRWNDNGNWDPYHYSNLDSLEGLKNDGSGNHTGYGWERVIVTFDCDGGFNTFASLEIEKIDVSDWYIRFQRIPYSGGARWEVLLLANGVLEHGIYQSWKPNILKFVVQSAMAGTVGAKMVWQ